MRTEKLSYSEDGVDLTLIRWMLLLTPAERLQVLQEQVKLIQILQHKWEQKMDACP